MSVDDLDLPTEREAMNAVLAAGSLRPPSGGATYESLRFFYKDHGGELPWRVDFYTPYIAKRSGRVVRRGHSSYGDSPYHCLLGALERIDAMAEQITAAQRAWATAPR